MISWKATNVFQVRGADQFNLIDEPLITMGIGVTPAQRTQNTTAFQNIITAFSTNKGRIIFIPAGRLELDTTAVSIKYLTGFYLRGADQGKTEIFGFGSLPVFINGNLGIGTCIQVVFQDLAIWNGAIKPAGSVAIHAKGVSYSKFERLLLKQFDTGLLFAEDVVVGTGGGYYNDVYATAIESCNVGIDIQAAGNNQTILGGRIFNCTTAGIQIAAAVGIKVINTAFEHNQTGILSHAGKGNSFDGYFEGNTDGAIIFEPGSYSNKVPSGVFSNEPDYVRDEDAESSGVLNLGSYITAGATPALHAAQKPFAGTRNLLTNPSFDVEYPAGSGFAAGWTFTSDAHSVFSISTDIPYPGTARSRSQKFTTDGANPVEHRMQRIVAVVPGKPYKFTGYVKVTGTKGFFIAAGSIGNVSLYWSSAEMAATTGPANNWQRFESPVIVAQDEQLLLSVTSKINTAGSVWLDDFDVREGRLPVVTSLDETIDRVETFGPIVASASSLPIFYKVQRVSGAITIDNLVPQDGFAGRITLIADAGASWSWSNVGVSPTAIAVAGGPVTPNMAYDFLYDPMLQVWIPLA